MKNNLLYNLGTAFITFILTAFITLWITPFIISNLGTEAYGFIPLTQNLISILTVLTFALSSVIARFFTVAISQEKYTKAEGYFNTYLITSVFVSIIIIIIIIIIILFIDQLINVPVNLLNDVKLAFLFSGILIIISFINSLFIAVPFSLNKLYITKSIEALNAILKALVIVILLTMLTPKIWFFHLGVLIAGVISLSISFYMFKKLMPNISINIQSFSINKLKELLSAGAWNSIGQIGVLLFLSIEVLVANIVFGASKAGVYAALLQLPLLLRTLAGVISGIFAPIIFRHYAISNMNGLINYSNKSVKLNGLVIALPAALLSAMASPILSLWLGHDFVRYKWLLVLNSIYLILTLSTLPLNHIFTAVNMMKVPGIVTLLLGIVNLILAFLLAVYTDLGLYGIVLAGAISLSLKNLFFIPLYVSHITNQSYFTYYKSVIQPVIGGVFAIISSIILQVKINITSWSELIFCGFIVAFCYLIISYFLLLNNEEKKILRNMYKSIVNRFN